jgi:alginate O-acetyltransferase complex protein AlgJ
MEQQATVTAVSRAPALGAFGTLAALTMLGVMAAGVWQIAGALRNPSELEVPWSAKDFWEGRSTNTLEKQLDHKLPARPALIAAANSARYLLTGGAGDQVRTGKDHWLFLTEELRFDAGGAEHLNARADLLAAAARGLARQDVKLVVALVPDKARVYAAKLARGAYPEYNRTRYQDALDALRRRDVAVVDLLQPLQAAARQGEVYYRSDTHWNQAGARVAAAAIAQTVRGLGLDLGQTTFVTAADKAPAERPGDLLRLMGLDQMPDALRPLPDRETPEVTSEAASASGAGLFGDAAVPVVLTGTSYSKRGNFHGYLQEALSAKVLNASKDGGGFLQATTDYLKDDAFKSAKPKVLVWEVPERFLLMKLDGEPGWGAKVGLVP